MIPYTQHVTVPPDPEPKITALVVNDDYLEVVCEFLGGTTVWQMKRPELGYRAAIAIANVITEAMKQHSIASYVDPENRDGDPLDDLDDDALAAAQAF